MRACPLKDLSSRQIVGRENPVDGSSGAGLVQGVAHHRETLRRGRIERHGDHARGQASALDLGAVAGLAQIARTRTGGKQQGMAAAALDKRARRHGARLFVCTTHVRDGWAQLAVDRYQGHADRVVLAQTLVVGARNDPVHAIADEQREVLALAVRPAHGITNEDAVAGVGEGVLDLDGQLAEEGQGHGGNDEANRLRALTVQGASQRVRAVAELLDRVGDVLLCLLREVAAVVEHARHGRQAHAGQLGDVGQRGFA